MPKKARLGIILVTVLLALIFLYDLFSNTSDKQMLLENFGRYPLKVGVIAWPIIVLPLALVLFWMRKRWGWLLLMLYVAYSVSYNAWIVSHLLTEDGRTAMGDQLAPAPSPTVFIAGTIFYLLIFLFLCWKKLREIYQVSEGQMLAAMACGVGLTLVAMFVI